MISTDCCGHDNRPSCDWEKIYRAAGPCIRPGGPVLTRRALEVCNVAPDSRVADIGCGAGGTLRHLEKSGFSGTVGLDSSGVLLDEAASGLASARLVQGRAEDLPFTQTLFDVLLCECVLSVLSQREAVLRECARVLKDGGFLIISDVFGTPDGGPEPPAEKLPGLTAEGLLTREGLCRLLEGQGFSLLLWEEHAGLIREFAARMILAGQKLPELWGCRRGGKEVKDKRSGLSYFLLVARKSVPHSWPGQDERDGGP